MFSGCFTSFDTAWVLAPLLDKQRDKEVEKELKKLALEAIEKKTPLIWLYWPYVDSSQGGDIERLLEDFVNTELKTVAAVKRRTRWGVSPTHLWHEKKANVVVLHIKINR
jgi:hypothetical protein